MSNPFQHVDLRIRDMDVAWAFYSKILPPIGFPEPHRGKTYSGFEAEGAPPNKPWFGFTIDEGHEPNANRISFWAASRERVDDLARIIREAGALNVSGPKDMPEYSATYYAVFFDDPFGNCLEVCYRED